MNGIFTEREARHLTFEEHQHYSTLGLCPPPSSDQCLAFAWEISDKRVTDLEEQVQQGELEVERQQKVVMDLRAELRSTRIAKMRAEHELEALKVFNSG